jgi:peptide/nickel transport system substrate-binding protein
VWQRHIVPAVLALAALAALIAAPPSLAKTLRVASAADPQSFDPHALALLYQTRIVSQIYESLVARNREYGLEPALAVSWESHDNRAWRFHLRRDVRFHDGSPFGADDVVFSLKRAMTPPSQRTFQVRGIAEVRKIDDATVDVVLVAPDVVFPEKLTYLAMMSRRWSVEHHVETPQDFNARQETWALRHANGTGPYRLERYEPDVRTELGANTDWWGERGNVDRIVYTVIASDATRLAALASGEVDFVVDPPFQDVARLSQDPRLTIVQIDDLGTQYLAFDQARDELGSGDVKGRNPFRDRRVRQAVYQAIDVDQIVRKVLRGLATPTGSVISRWVGGYSAEFERRLAYDPDTARALLREAGYPEGFGVTLDCVNLGFREAACQAIAAMLTRVGIRTALQVSPPAVFFPKLTQAAASLVEFGFTPGTDAFVPLDGLLHTFGPSSGTFNAGRYGNPALDRILDAARIEADPARRASMFGDAQRTIRDDIAIVPLYRRTLSWVMRRGVQVVQWPSDILEVRYVRVD